MTSISFDEAKALREEISGLAEIISTLNIRVRSLEQKLSETEIEYNSVVKLHGFAVTELERKHKVLRRIEEQK